MEPPLWVKGDRGRSEKQEILTARWGCPVREGGVVHLTLYLKGRGFSTMGGKNENY